MGRKRKKPQMDISQANRNQLLTFMQESHNTIEVVPKALRVLRAILLQFEHTWQGRLSCWAVSDSMDLRESRTGKFPSKIQLASHAHGLGYWARKTVS